MTLTTIAWVLAITLLIAGCILHIMERRSHATLGGGLFVIMVAVAAALLVNS